MPLQVQKSKSGTGRVVGFRELGLVNAYTMEASFAGAAVGKYAKQHFNTGELAAAVPSLAFVMLPIRSGMTEHLLFRMFLAFWIPVVRDTVFKAQTSDHPC